MKTINWLVNPLILNTSGLGSGILSIELESLNKSKIKENSTKLHENITFMLTTKSQ